MYLYYNKNGELLTMIPHGEIPRQNNFLNLYICLDYDYFNQEVYSNINLGEDNSNFKMLIDITKPNKISCLDNIPSKVSYEQFRKTNDSEATFALVDNRSYWTFEFKIAPELATNIAGNIKVAVKTFVINQSGEIIISTIRNFTVATIFVEKTYTNPNENDDSTYFQLQRQINLINTNLILLENKVNRLTAVGIEIDLQDIGYVEPVGDFIPSNFSSYCSNFENGKILIYSFSEEAKQQYPKLWNFLKSCNSAAVGDYNEVVISNIYNLIYEVKMSNSSGIILSYEHLNNQWDSNKGSSIIVSETEPTEMEAGDLWYEIV